MNSIGDDSESSVQSGNNNLGINSPRASSRSVRKIGPIELEPGLICVTYMSLFIGRFFTIDILSLISMAANYVLFENLGISFSERATLVNDLAL
ncbi:MAG: hypothetical protein ACJAYG_001108 [Oceanicoccus sp.]|jgi:hypothetical protein